MDYHTYDQYTRALDAELKTIASFAKHHGYQSRIADPKYNRYYRTANYLCGEIIKLRGGII